MGVKVSETIAEVTTAMVSVSANSRNMRPTRPVMNSSGMNTAISETVSEITVKPISLAPRNAASNGSSPSSMWCTMFSIITMASSTTKPVPIVSAISERLSSEKPQNHITPNVAISDSGSATPAMIVAQILERDAVIGEPRQVGLDADRRADVALDGDAADAGELAQSLRDQRVGDVAERAHRDGVGGDRQRHHRCVGRVHLGIDRRVRQ